MAARMIPKIIDECVVDRVYLKRFLVHRADEWSIGYREVLDIVQSGEMHLFKVEMMKEYRINLPDDSIERTKHDCMGDRIVCQGFYSLDKSYFIWLSQ